MRFHKSLFTSILLTAAIHTTPAFASNYIYTDLGTLGGSMSNALGINNSGQVVGFSNVSGNSSHHAFLYSNGNMQDLGTLGGTDSIARGINDSGQVVGDSNTTSSQHGFLYSNGQMWDLGGSINSASGINDSGVIVGNVNPSGNNAGHGVIYGNGSIQNLPFYLSGINNKGQTTGFNSSPTHALVWDSEFKDLGTLGGVYSAAFSINDLGQVTGDSYTTGNAADHAFLYSNGIMQDLGTLGGTHSYAYGINNNGQVVGQSLISGNNMYHASLYSDGKLIDLNSLLDEGTIKDGWYLNEANAINDNNWIVGTAINTITGASHAYLLSIAAVPETDTYAMLLAGLGLVGFIARRK